MNFWLWHASTRRAKGNLDVKDLNVGVGKSGYLLMFRTFDTCEVWSYTFNSVKKMQLTCYTDKTTQSLADMLTHTFNTSGWSRSMQFFIYIFSNYQLHIIMLMLLIFTFKRLCSLESLMRYSRKIALLPAKRVTLNLILKKTMVEEGDKFWAHTETVRVNYLLIRGWESEMHSLFSLAEIMCWCGVQKSSMLLH